jgi:hypothetical protein
MAPCCAPWLHRDSLPLLEPVSIQALLVELLGEELLREEYPGEQQGGRAVHDNNNNNDNNGTSNNHTITTCPYGWQGRSWVWSSAAVWISAHHVL